MVSQKVLKDVCGTGIYNNIPHDDVTLLDITHDRMYDEYGNLLSRGGHTVAVVKIKQKEFIGLSQCHEMDNYCKMEGRKRAVKEAFLNYWEVKRVERKTGLILM